jgi:hypothetical protein
MQLAALGRTTAINAVAALMNSGMLRIYSSDAADPDSAATGTLLAELSFGSTAFQSATDDGTNASAVANAITQDSNANASGTAAHWRSFNSSGTMVLKGTVSGTGGGGELQLNNTAIVSGGIVSISSMTLRAPQGS